MKTAEFITEGHPDKICDQIADAILDSYLYKDPETQASIEIFGSHGLLVIGGKVASKGAVDIESVARKVYADIGYPDPLEIFPTISINPLRGPADLSYQGVIHGYATSETEEYLPLPYVSARRLAQGVSDLRRMDRDFSWLKPEAKVQLTTDGRRAVSVAVTVSRNPDISEAEAKSYLMRSLIQPITGNAQNLKVLITAKPAEQAGGFAAKTGLTGRKLMADSYGALIPHGGGAYSGKDPSNIDRTAAYFCRYAAKNLVANGYAKNCLVTVAYALGQEAPIMLHARSGEKDLTEIAAKHFDFRPKAMIERLDLKRPIFQQTASFGHFGKPGLPWEEIVKL